MPQTRHIRTSAPPAPVQHGDIAVETTSHAIGGALDVCGSGGAEDVSEDRVGERQADKVGAAVEVGEDLGEELVREGGEACRCGHLGWRAD